MGNFLSEILSEGKVKRTAMHLSSDTDALVVDEKVLSFSML